jgi:hypothetical protein
MNGSSIGGAAEMNGTSSWTNNFAAFTTMPAFLSEPKSFLRHGLLY